MRSLARIAPALAATFLLLAATHPAARPTASPAAKSQAHFTFGEWNIHTALVDFNLKTNDFSAPQHVLVTRDGTTIDADRANGNAKSGQATLFGHVVLHDQNGNLGGLSSAKNASGRGPATLTADKMTIDEKTRIYTAVGYMHYTQADTIVDAQSGKLNDITHELDLHGNVHVRQGARSLIADHVLYNTITGQAVADGNVILRFPSQIRESAATPKPIVIKNPKIIHD